MSLVTSYAAVALAGFAAIASADIISSDFNASDEGWLVSDGSTPFNESVSVSPDHRPTGGNDLGFITTPGDWRTSAFFVAPAAYLGDRSGALGERLEVDRQFVRPDRLSDVVQTDFDFDITITGADGGLTLAADLDPVTLSVWEHFSVEFIADGTWFHLDSGIAATEAELLSVLSDLEDLRVRGNVRPEFGNVGIDNFTLVPSPGAASLLALAGLACTRRRR